MVVYSNEDTPKKVYDAIRDADVDAEKALEIIRNFEEKKLLFREEFVPGERVVKMDEIDSEVGFEVEDDALETLRRKLSPDTRTPSEIIQYFYTYMHLPEEHRVVARRFANMAEWIDESVKSGPEKAVTLRKLLESRDAALRAII